MMVSFVVIMHIFVASVCCVSSGKQNDLFQTTGECLGAIGVITYIAWLLISIGTMI